MSFLDELKKLTRPYDDEDDEDMDDAERLDEPEIDTPSQTFASGTINLKVTIPEG